jgi:hypothetical protein
VPFKPSNYTSVVPDLLKIAKSHEETTEQPTEITPQMVEQMASGFKERSSCFVAMKAIEMLCGVALGESEMAHILNPSSDIPPSAYATIFQKTYFKHIDQSSINTVLKWGAKCFYHVIHGCASLFIHSAIDSVRKDMETWRKKGIKKKGKDVIRMARNIFFVMSGAYTSVARTKAEDEKDILQLLAEAVDAPKRNAGLRPKERYAALVQTALTFVRIDWTKKIARYFDASIVPPDSIFAFLNPVLDGVNFFCKKTLQGIAFLPQKILNFLIQRTTSFIVLRSIKLHTLVDEHLDKMADPLTPISFSLHLFGEKKIREIVELMRERLNQPQEASSIPSHDVRWEMEACVKILLEVLHKSHKLTVEELRQHDRSDRTFLEKMEREVKAYVIPQAMAPIAAALWPTLQETLSEKFLLEMEYNLFDIGNNAFNVQKNVAPEDFEVVDKEISDLTDELIDIIMQKILDDKLDLDNAKQQKEIHAFTETFKEHIDQFLLDVQEGNKIIDDPMVLEEQRAQSVKKVNAAMHTLIHQEVGALGKAGVNDRLHRGTNSQFNEMSKEFKDKIKPLSKKIKQMNKLQNEIEAHQGIIEAYTEAREALGTLVHTLRHPEEVFNHPEQYAAILDRHMQVLGKQTLYDANELIEQHKQLKESEKQLKSTQTSIVHLQNIEARWTAYIDRRLHDEDQENAEIGKLYKSIMRRASHLPENHQMNLRDTLSQIHQSDNPAVLEELSDQFNEDLADAQNDIRTQLEEQRVELQTIRETMETHFQRMEHSETVIDDKRMELLRVNKELQADIEDLEVWEQEKVKDITIINFNPVPFMKWVQDTVHSLAVTETKKIMEEVRDFMLLPFVYKCVINQLGVKFLNKYGNRHVKKP